MRVNDRLTGKVAIGTGVVGTNIGKGRAIAVLLAVCRAKVLCLDVYRAVVEGTERMIAAERHAFRLQEANSPRQMMQSWQWPTRLLCDHSIPVERLSCDTKSDNS
jgi:hypothetical protein